MLWIMCAQCIGGGLCRLIPMLCYEIVDWMAGVCEWACWDLGDRLWGLIFSQCI